jgi:hypothetical protein
MSSNIPIHCLVRPVMRRLARTRVTPNHLTTLRLAAGIAAAAAFACGGTTWPGIGGGVFVLSMLLERADGDDALVLAPVAMWCDAALPLLAVAAVVTPLAAAWLVTRRPAGAPRGTARTAPRRTAPEG